MTEDLLLNFFLFYLPYNDVAQSQILNISLFHRPVKRKKKPKTTKARTAQPLHTLQLAITVFVLMYFVLNLSGYL